MKGNDGTDHNIIAALGLPHNEKRKTLRFGRFEVSLTVANIFFAFLAVAGQVGVNVSLPLWIDSTISSASGGAANNTNSTSYLLDAGFLDANSNRSNSSGAGGGEYQPRVDAFFILVFGSFSFVVIFGVTLLLIRIFQPHNLGETERRFPHSQLFLVGLFDALNGVLTVFAGSGSRTAPYLQAILGNFTIPLTMTFR